MSPRMTDPEFEKMQRMLDWMKEQGVRDPVRRLELLNDILKAAQ